MAEIVFRIIGTVAATLFSCVNVGWLIYTEIPKIDIKGNIPNVDTEVKIPNIGLDTNLPNMKIDGNLPNVNAETKIPDLNIGLGKQNMDLNGFMIILSFSVLMAKPYAVERIGHSSSSMISSISLIDLVFHSLCDICFLS